MSWRSQYDDVYVQNEAAGRFKTDLNDYELEEIVARHIRNQDNGRN